MKTSGTDRPLLTEADVEAIRTRAEAVPDLGQYMAKVDRLCAIALREQTVRLCDVIQRQSSLLQEYADHTDDATVWQQTEDEMKRWKGVEL